MDKPKHKYFNRLDELLTDIVEQSVTLMSGVISRFGGSDMAKVLIIEDDPLMSRMYQKIFSFEKFEVEMAGDGPLYCPSIGIGKAGSR